jgi:Asp-tRNA(Asn)/Glu-tRNA(Gln) amidotransferase A subunit family amidase
MKVIISQPMKGKSEEQIRDEREETVKLLAAEGYEVVDTVFPDFTDQGNIPLKYLAKSLEAIADVDLVFFMPGWENARGCWIERQCCLDYGIPVKDAGAVKMEAKHAGD